MSSADAIPNQWRLAGLGSASALLTGALSYAAHEWLVLLLVAWVVLVTGGVVMFRNYTFRAMALGALIGLSAVLGYLIWGEHGLYG